MTPSSAVKKQAAPPPLDEAKVMTGVLALLVAEREDRLNAGDEKYKPAKTEVLLSGAGLTAPEVAQVTGKNIEAVRKAIQRGRK